MTTALEIIKAAMRKNGVLFKSENPSSDEANDALEVLNNLLSSWSNSSILIYTRVVESFPLVSGTASYTIGDSQTFDTDRPIMITEAHTRSGSTDYPCRIINEEDYQDIADKTAQGIPYYLSYSNNYPTATITLYPKPSGGLTLYLTSEKELTQLTLYQSISLPPGWKRALIYNLAIELAPEYGQEVSPVVVSIAQESKAQIASAIMRNKNLDAPVYPYISPYSINRGY